jgi:hypothetical protein
MRPKLSSGGRPSCAYLLDQGDFQIITLGNLPVLNKLVWELSKTALARLASTVPACPPEAGRGYPTSGELKPIRDRFNRC